jgi:hypothetical protein
MKSLSMKYIKSIALISIMALFACNQDIKETSETDSTDIQNEITDNSNEIADVPYYAELDSNSQNFTLIKSDLVDKNDLTPINLKDALNRKYPEIFISETRISNDTIYVTIPNAKHLTQGIGSMGAKIYMTESTHSFTDLPNIKYVKYNFNVGDHAYPGVYTKEDFKFIKTTK